ncbi:unnamed protein product, partial [Tetraodon nigroviridis]
QKTMLRYYLFEGMRHVWLAKRGTFCRVSVLNKDWTCKDLYGFQKGLTHLEQRFRYSTHSTFSSWAASSCGASIITTLTPSVYLSSQSFPSSVSLYEIRKVSKPDVCVCLLLPSGQECVSSVDLVPGDCLIIPQEGLVLPCDVALLAGECLVNESMLTGESVPVLKTPLLPGEGTYSAESERRHTLFSGTHLIQAKGGGPGGPGAVAVVTNTGFFTAKGSLVSSIMYPQPINFRFYQDAAKFLLILAMFGTTYSFVVLYRSRASLKELIIRALDVVTIVVPPALPAAMTTGTIYAQGRLKKQGIFCISPPRINVSGKLSAFCFDKTGTLTEEDLDVWGVMEGGAAGFSEMVPDPRRLPHGHMLSGLACCHTVTLFKEQLLGDPLELKMIESTGWSLEEPNELDAAFGGHRVLAVMRSPAQDPGAEANVGPSVAVAVVQRFPFSSALQRMSVVTAAPQGRLAFAYMKGSPEMVASLCRAETVPSQFSSQLRTFSSEGLRVLALAYKPLDGSVDLKNIERGEVERDMLFLGLLMMKNLVKPESERAIAVLRRAQLRCIMVTGDNILTAVNVAKSCGMVGYHERVIFVNAASQTAASVPTLTFDLEDEGRGTFHSSADVITQGLYQSGFSYHMAISGRSFCALCDHFPQYLPKVLLRTTVFARMTPDQKTRLVKELQKLNYRVGMCGDGANDCGALRAADVGVSLSEAEASVASPFTSKSGNISCVPTLIREGRCSLITSFSLFRYMALYSLSQFSSVLILYTLRTTLGDLQFLFLDICLMTLLAVVMGRGGPSLELQPCRPPASLLALPVLGSILVHTAMIVLGQLAALFVTTSQAWCAGAQLFQQTHVTASRGGEKLTLLVSYSRYIPLNSTRIGAENLPNMENSSVFVLSGFQYIIMAVVVTKSYPHKKPLYCNRIFLCLALLLVAVMTWLVIYPGAAVAKFLQLYDFKDTEFKVLLLALAALNFFVCFLFEALIDLGVLNCLRPRKRPSKKQYKRLNDSLLNSPSWPPLN